MFCNAPFPPTPLPLMVKCSGTLLSAPLKLHSRARSHHGSGGRARGSERNGNRGERACQVGPVGHERGHTDAAKPILEGDQEGAGTADHSVVESDRGQQVEGVLDVKSQLGVVRNPVDGDGSRAAKGQRERPTGDGVPAKVMDWTAFPEGPQGGVVLFVDNPLLDKGCADVKSWFRSG